MSYQDGWCDLPFIAQHRGPGREGPFGYPAGTHGQNTPDCFCDHRMAGHKPTLDNDAWRRENYVGVHFGTGQDAPDEGSQYASIWDASWGNGVGGSIDRYMRSNRHLAAWERLGTWRKVNMGSHVTNALVDRLGVNVPNSHSITTEHEDHAIDDLQWSGHQFLTDVRIKHWCIAADYATGRRRLVIDDDLLIGHFMIDAVNRPDCPGLDTWPRARLLAALKGKDPYRMDTETRNAILEIGKAIAREGDERKATDGFVVQQLARISVGQAAAAERDLRWLYVLANKSAEFPARQ